MNERLEEARRKLQRKRQIRAAFKRRRDAGLKRRHEKKLTNSQNGNAS